MASKSASIKLYTNHGCPCKSSLVTLHGKAWHRITLTTFMNQGPTVPTSPLTSLAS